MDWLINSQNSNPFLLIVSSCSCSVDHLRSADFGYIRAFIRGRRSLTVCLFLAYSRICSFIVGTLKFRPKTSTWYTFSLLIPLLHSVQFYIYSAQSQQKLSLDTSHVEQVYTLRDPTIPTMSEHLATVSRLIVGQVTESILMFLSWKKQKKSCTQLYWHVVVLQFLVHQVFLLCRLRYHRAHVTCCCFLFTKSRVPSSETAKFCMCSAS